MSGRRGVKGGLRFWWRAGMRDWRLLFPGSPMMVRRETGAEGLRGLRFCVPSRPVVWVSGGRQCRWLHSSLRVPPAGAGDAWGGSASGAVRRGQPGRRPRRRGGGAENRATSRLAAGQDVAISGLPSPRTRVRWTAVASDETSAAAPKSLTRHSCSALRNRSPGFKSLCSRRQSCARATPKQVRSGSSRRRGTADDCQLRRVSLARTASASAWCMWSKMARACRHA
jgi:hypothetical protein